jgi:hypothetical protein
MVIGIDLHDIGICDRFEGHGRGGMVGLVEANGT